MVDSQVAEASKNDGKQIADIYKTEGDHNVADAKVRDALTKEFIQSQHSERDMGQVLRSFEDEAKKLNLPDVIISNDKGMHVTRDWKAFGIGPIKGNSVFEITDGMTAVKLDQQKRDELAAQKKAGESQTNPFDGTMGLSTLFNKITSPEKK